MTEQISLTEYQELTKPKHKFFATRTEVDGIWFASKKEAARYCQLKILERSGAIKNLILQPEFPLVVNDTKVCTYRADFSYFDMKAAAPVVEDCKGFRTKEYMIKKKLFEALYGRKILET
jgi:uncharacterized protein DUF1064